MAATHLWVNVDGSDDPGYRYRMPRAEVCVERRGTLLKNCGEIAKALHRPPQYLAKFCGLLLGCHAEFDEEQRAAVIRGDHLPATVHGLVRKFIDGWVLCARCRLPETRLEVGRSKVIFDCKACGARRGASAEHKLTAFIVSVCRRGSNPEAAMSVCISAAHTRGARLGQNPPDEKCLALLGASARGGGGGAAADAPSKSARRRERVERRAEEAKEEAATRREARLALPLALTLTEP